METNENLIWEISTQGTTEQLRAFFGAEELKSFLPKSSLDANPHSFDALPTKALRSKDGLIEAQIFKTKHKVSELIESIRDYWVILRRKNLASASPTKILITSDVPNTIILIFKWKNLESRTRAHMDTEVVNALNSLGSSSASFAQISALNEIYQGFDTKKFPAIGGNELLRGKCTCKIKFDGLDGEVELDGQNGFVIMHRGPNFSHRGANMMPITILEHGADSPNPFELDVKLGKLPNFKDTRVRVEQNSELPQFGIVRAMSNEADFPAVAMWVVHWRIHTPIGTIITDPKVPLVFGPTIVNHYPPVGTEFKSAIGPVDVYEVESMKVIGKLVPGELTAFDIVTTLDDEIPSIMDVPARYHVEMFNKYVDKQYYIDPEGLENDYRVRKIS